MAVNKRTKKTTRARNPPNADVDGCFEITLARNLAGKRTKRVQIQKAISQHGRKLSQLQAHKRVELAAALQWEFRRRASWVKHDDMSLQTLQHQYRQVRDFVIPIYRLPIEVLTSVDSPPRRENRSPRFGGLHLLGEQVETPPLPPGLGNRQISADKHM